MRTERGRRPPSLALRATTMTGLATTAILLLFTWSVEHSIQRHFAALDLVALRTTAASVQSVLAQGVPDQAAQQQLLLSTRMAGHGTTLFDVLGENGRPLFGTAPPSLIDVARQSPSSSGLTIDALQIWRAAGHAYRGAVLQTRDGRLLVATAIDFHLDYLARLRRELWAGAAVASLLSILAAWLALQHGHAPIRRMASRMRDIGSERLHVRLEPAQAPVELIGLVEAFNALLDRLEASFRQLSDVAADIAHELRTPVTNLTTQTQVALSKARSAADYREVLYSNLEEYERMAAMIGDMLFLAQADHQLIRVAQEPVRLMHEVRTLFDYFEAWAEERGVVLRLIGDDLAVRGDAPMLQRALSNLLANAIRHTAPGQSVSVRIAADDTSVDITVENPGPDIAAEHLPHLFERFYRVDPSRVRGTDGAGLGLSIVRSIAHAHGGTVAVQSSSGLTRFRIKLPAAEALKR